MSREALQVLSPMLRDVPITPRPRYVGVYLLIRDDEVVYVGQSTDIESRIASQWAMTRTSNKKTRLDFNRVLWMPVAVEELDDYEAALIYALAPEYNTGAPHVDAARRAAIRDSLALPPTDLARLAGFLARRQRSYADARRERHPQRKASR